MLFSFTDLQSQGQSNLKEGKFKSQLIQRSSQIEQEHRRAYAFKSNICWDSRNQSLPEIKCSFAPTTGLIYLFIFFPWKVIFEPQSPDG